MTSSVQSPELCPYTTLFRSAAITTLVLLGQVLELRARSRTGAAIRSLLDLSPKTARLLHDEREEDVPLEQVKPGDRLDRKSTRLNSSHVAISYAVFCLKKKR